MKFVIVVAVGLLLAGCGLLRDAGALAYCAANQGDINRRCQ